MANSLLPPEERNLTPDQVEALDKRRDLGHTFLVIAGQFAVIATILLLWVGQDLTYSPGWAHPMAYYFAIAWPSSRSSASPASCCARARRGWTERILTRRLQVPAPKPSSVFRDAREAGAGITSW
jgi:hypothetical protein